MGDISLAAQIDPCGAAIEKNHKRWMFLRYFLCSTGGTDSVASGVAATYSHGHREECCLKLVANHEPLLRDITNPGPRTQHELNRVGQQSAEAVDNMLIECTRRLLGNRPGLEQMPVATLDPLDIGAVQAWAGTYEYLLTRIQDAPEQKPGRAPDLSPEAGAAMKDVLRELAGA